jgi:hypothetical protein
MWARGSVSSDLETFASDVLPLVNRPFKLVTTDGDCSMPSQLSHAATTSILESAYLQAWYTQNYDGTVVHEKLRPVPIGFDLHTDFGRHSVSSPVTSPEGEMNHMRRFREKIRKQQREDPLFERSGAVLVGGWDDSTNILRAGIAPSLNTCETCYHIDNHRFRDDLWELYANLKFGVSPPGGGLDSHRTYEMLYFGMIPIVLEGQVPHNLFENSLPVIIVKSYEDILTADLGEWAKSVEHLLPVPEEAFTLQYWMRSKEERSGAANGKGNMRALNHVY